MIFFYLALVLLAGLAHEIGPWERLAFTLGYGIASLFLWLLWAKFKRKIAVHIV